MPRYVACSQRAFTLVELMIAMALTGVLAVAVMSLFSSQSRQFETQEEIIATQQNLRAVMEVMQKDLRWAGYDPALSDTFGVTDVRRLDVAGAPALGGEDAITFTAADNDFVGGDDTYVYRIYLSGGVRALGRQLNGAAIQPLGLNVERLGFAYAYADGFGGLTLNPATGQPFWAFDSDNDGFLDSHLDTNNDGIIDINDAVAGAALPVLVPPAEIRAVKIWILGVAARPDPRYQAAGIQYKIGNRSIAPPNDNLRRELVTSVVSLRNLGM